MAVARLMPRIAPVLLDYGSDTGRLCMDCTRVPHLIYGRSRKVGSDFRLVQYAQNSLWPPFLARGAIGHGVLCSRRQRKELLYFTARAAGTIAGPTKSRFA